MTTTFNPLDYPICFSKPHRLVIPSAWVEHIPFAMFLTEILKPNILVELGTHTGNSYSAFCQAVSQLNTNTKCYAVDTWEGDEHAGFYGQEILIDLQEYHDPLYSHFSRLMQMEFDDAVNYFSDGSIDLLHIDGLHTYDAVKHDFETWLPKLSIKGVVILHDINVREHEFGVWKVWEELKQTYTHLEFFHGNGLGVLSIGNDPFIEQQIISIEKSEAAKEFFASIGAQYELMVRTNQSIEQLKADLAEQDRSIQQLSADLAELEQEVLFYSLSKSWRITRPLRILGKALRGSKGV